MKKKKIIAIIVILLLIIFGFKCLRNKWMSNKDKNITIEETKEEKQKENKNKISKNEKERKDNKKDLNNMKDKKSNNKFNNNNFARDNVDRSTDIRPIKPGEFPIEHDGNINDNQSGGNQKDKTGTNNPGKGSQEQNTQKPDKSGNKKPEISKPVKPNIKKPEISKPENPDTKKSKNPKPDNPEEGVIEQEELEKEKLSKLLTIFTKNYRVNQGLVFNSKNKNKLPDEAYIGFKSTGENDGKLHKINWSGDQLEDVKTNKPGKYQLKVEVEDEFSIAEKKFDNISFYVSVVIK